MNFTARPDRRLITAEEGGTRYVYVSIEAPSPSSPTTRPPVNLALVLDRSGSMAHGKLDRARDAVLRTLGSLDPNDRFSVVVYDNVVDVLVPSCPATRENRARAVAALLAVTPRGMTDLFAGCLRGCEQVAKHLREEDVGRCLLLTDGLANEGLTDGAEIVKHIAALRERRVSTTTFGVGRDFDEMLLRRMAEAGGGNFYFIQSAAQIPDLVASEVGETLEVVARDAALLVEPPAGIEVACLNGNPVRQVDGDWRVDLGALVSRQHLELVLALEAPPRPVGETAEVFFRLVDRDEILAPVPSRVEFTYSGREACEAQPLDRSVGEKVARLRATVSTNEALELNREGRLDEAQEALERCAAEIRVYAGDDERIRVIALELEGQEAVYRDKLDPGLRKHMYFKQYARQKGRRSDGRSIRSAGGSGVVLMPACAALEPVARSALEALGRRGVRMFGGLELACGLSEHTTLHTAEWRGGILRADAEHELVRLSQNIWLGDHVRLLLTARRHDDNWFSHWHGYARTAVISTSDWGSIAAVAPEAFIAYETLLYGLNALDPAMDPLNLLHTETRGCLFDFCKEKTDIEIKLQTMDLCEACLEGLGRHGVDATKLLELCESVRGLARSVPQARLGSGKGDAGRR